MKETKNKVTAIAMATTIAVTSMAPVPATTVYSQELDKLQIEAKVNEENKEQDNAKVEAPVIENKKDEEVKEETNKVENNENAEEKENTNDKVNEEEKDNVKEEEIKDNVENKEETEVKDNIENKEETEVKNDVEKNEATENTEIKDNTEKVEDKTSEKVENEELAKTEEVENKEKEEKESAAEKVVGVAIDAANFPDEAFRKYVSENFDIDKDGVLSDEEANSVKEISLSFDYYDYYNRIEDLKGIEHFKNLESLTCNRVRIKYLDVSKNTALKSLMCYDAPIKSLDISKNTALTKLICGNTEITSLDVSKNTALIELSCYDKGITNLDVSKNIALEKLNCSRTGITNLDVSKNTALTGLTCSSTGITNLDVSKNTALKWLTCIDTGITNLDVSKNTALTSLNCGYTGITNLDVSKNTALRELNCYNTRITSLDVSKNTELTILGCKNTEITSLNIGNNPNLYYISKDNSIQKELTIAGNSFDITKELDIIDVTKIENMQGATINGNIVSGYSYNTPITFEYNCGTSVNGKEFLNVVLSLIKGEGVSGLTINETSFPDEVFRNYVSDNFDIDKDGVLSDEEANSVKEIYVDDNKSIRSLKGIEHFKNLEVLDCSSTGVTSLDVSKNTALKDLNVSNNKELTSLDLSNNTALKELDCSNTGLTRLDVSNNKELTSLNCSNTEIESLNIGDNPNLPSINKDNTMEKELTIAGNSFDITKELDIIDVTKIENMQGATLNGNIVSGYSYETPITFEYNCGTSANGKEVLKVTLNIKNGNALIENTWKVAPSIKGWTYGEKANAPVGKAEHGKVTFTYSNSRDGKFESTVPSNAGTWYMKATVSATDEYKGLSEIVEFKIEKATPKYEIPTNLKSTVGQTLKDIKLPEGFEWVDATQSVGNAGTNKFMAKYTPKDTANYNVVENIEITVTVSKVVAPEVIEPSNLSAKQDSLLSTIKLPEGWTWTNPTEVVTAKNKGYKARLKVDDEKYDYTNVQGYNADGHYVERTLKVSVLKGENAWKVAPSIKGWTYGEKANAPVGSAEHGRVTFTYSNSKDGKFENTVPSNAGTWYMKATVSATDEYKELSEIVEFKIEKATPKYEIPTNLKSTVGQTLKDIKLPEGFEWVDATQSVGNAGTNKFMAKYTPKDTANYNVVENIEITVTVSKVVAPEVIEPSNLSAKQDSLLSTIKLPEGWTWTNPTEVVTAKNKGYKARLKVDDEKYDYTNVQGYNADGHYVERTLKVFVSENRNEWSVVPSIKGWTYGEKANTPLGTANHGDVTFTYSNSPNGKFESAVPSNAGTWYMKATVLLTENHTGLNEIVEFKIEKATPKYEIPTNLKSTVGQTLKDIKLPEGFEWVDATQSVGNAGTNKFMAKYTPKDTANYNVVENIEITVTVSNNNNNSNNNNSINNGNNSNNSSNGNKDEVVVKPTLPQTGERNTLGLWGLVLTITGGAIAFLTGKNRKTIKK